MTKSVGNFNYLRRAASHHQVFKSNPRVVPKREYLCAAMKYGFIQMIDQKDIYLCCDSWPEIAPALLLFSFLPPLPLLVCLRLPFLCADTAVNFHVF